MQSGSENGMHTYVGATGSDGMQEGVTDLMKLYLGKPHGGTRRYLGGTQEKRGVQWFTHHLGNSSVYLATITEQAYSICWQA